MSLSGVTSFNAVESRTAGYVPVFGQTKAETEASFLKVLNDTAPKAAAPTAAKNAGAGETGSGGFMDFIFAVIDIINPLQHLPVISTIYRHLTGDEISPMARVAGDALYGGPIGAGIALADVAIEHATGKDMGENVLAMVRRDKEEAPRTMIASKAPATININEIVWDTPAPVIEQAVTDKPLGVPRDQVAFQMMEALDKYAAMKKPVTPPPAVSGLF